MLQRHFLGVGAVGERAGNHQGVVDVRAGVPRVVVVLPIHGALNRHGFGGVVKERLVIVFSARVRNKQAGDLVAIDKVVVIGHGLS